MTQLITDRVKISAMLFVAHMADNVFLLMWHITAVTYVFAGICVTFAPEFVVNTSFCCA